MNKIKNFLLVFCLVLFATSESFSAHDWKAVIEVIWVNPESLDLQEIAGGATNRNYRLRIDSEDFFVRMPLTQDIDLNADLGREFEILEKLAPFGCSPKPYYYSAEKQTMITEFIYHDGTTIDLNCKKDRNIILSMVKKIHNSGLKIDSSFDPYAAVRKFLDTLADFDDSFSSVIRDKILQKIDCMEKDNIFIKDQALCHHDLHVGNILQSGNNFYLLDWEYGAMSDPLFDVASIAALAFWDQAQLTNLLAEYNPDYTSHDLDRVYSLKTLADIYWYLWCEIQLRLHCNSFIYDDWSRKYFDSLISNL